SPSVTNLNPSRSCTDRLDNRPVFDGRERGLIDFAFGKAGTFAHQFRRTQQAADMFGSERRLRRGCIRSGRVTEIHDAKSLSRLQVSAERGRSQLRPVDYGAKLDRASLYFFVLERSNDDDSRYARGVMHSRAAAWRIKPWPCAQFLCPILALNSC